MANKRRLIDVSDEHIKEILAPVPYYPDEIWKFTAMTKRFPTAADVAPVRRGEWVVLERGAVSTIFKYSECGRTVDVCNDYFGKPSTHTAKQYPYCRCGARMDGGADNGLQVYDFCV